MSLATVEGGELVMCRFRMGFDGRLIATDVMSAVLGGLADVWRGEGVEPSVVAFHIEKFCAPAGCDLLAVVEVLSAVEHRLGGEAGRLITFGMDVHEGNFMVACGGLQVWVKDGATESAQDHCVAVIEGVR